MAEIVRNIVIGILLAAPIGPAGLAVIQAGLRGGFRRAFPTGLGITAADATYLLVAFFGMAGLLQIDGVKIGMWLFGAVVLLYIGGLGLRDAMRPQTGGAVQEALNTKTGGDGVAPEAVASARRHPLVVGYLVNISNPLAIVFWLGIFGALIGGQEMGTGIGPRLAALGRSSAILVGILAWHTTNSVITHFARRFLNLKLIRVINGIAGIALIGFGLRFGWLALKAIFG